MAKIVFDASAVLAFLRSEPGAEVVASYGGDALISAVNYQEVIHHMLKRGFLPEIVEQMLAALHLDVRPHDQADATMAATLYSFTEKFGCGLGDRSCLALASRKNLPVLTTYQIWSKLNIPDLEVRLAR